MSTRNRWFGACLALLVPCSVLAQSDAAPMEAQWREFFATAKAERVFKAYREVLAVDAEGGGVDPARCREKAQVIADAVALVPVGAAILDRAYRCAVALGDDAAAEAALARLAAVARHALDSASMDPLAPPVRVVLGSDFYAILRAAGLEHRYEYAQTVPLSRYLVVRVAAWDPEAKVERHFRFDYVDSILRMRADEPETRFPAFRRRYIGDFINSLRRDDVLIGLDLGTVRDSGGIEDPRERVARLRPMAERGGLQSALAWMIVCQESPFPGCGEGLLDAMLPAAEQGQGLPTVILALAHALGLGVEPDLSAAMHLLDAADAVWEGGGATVEFAIYYDALAGAPYPAPLAQRLQALAEKGNVHAGVLLAEPAAGESLDPGARAALERAAVAGSVSAKHLLALHDFDDLSHEAALPSIQRAAEAGSGAAQELYARYFQYGWGRDKDPARALEWWQQAALNGDTDAMRTLGWLAVESQAWTDAQEWFRSAALGGDVGAAQALADLYLEGHEGLDGDRERALLIYNDLAKREDAADVRRSLAGQLVAGGAFETDLDRARALLEQDARAGDRQSEILLGVLLMRGELGEPDREAGMGWLAKGLEARDPEAIDALAMHHYYFDGTPESRQQALALWRSLPDTDQNIVLNNLAWVLCTSPDPAVAAAGEGLATARRMGPVEDLPAGLVDTVAACHAASGDFDEAVRVQQLALAAFESTGLGEDEVAPIRERLASYRAGRAYVEAEDAKPGE